MASRATTDTAAAAAATSEIGIGSGSEDLTYLQMSKSYVKEEGKRYGEEEMGKEINLKDQYNRYQRNKDKT